MTNHTGRDSEGAAPSSIEEWKAEHLPNATREAEMHRAVENGTAGELIAKRVLEAAVAAPVVPQGWKLVPVDPDRQILQAMHDGPLGADDHTMTAEVEAWLIEMYKTAIGVAAAPSALNAPVVELSDERLRTMWTQARKDGISERLDGGSTSNQHIAQLRCFARSLLAAQNHKPHSVHFAGGNGESCAPSSEVDDAR